MISLKIIGIEQNKYLLIDEKNNKIYDLFLEFYGLEAPIINDQISIDERLLNKKWEGYTQPYAFELVKSEKEYDKENNIDYMVLTTKQKQLVLRRIYG